MNMKSYKSIHFYEQYNADIPDLLCGYRETEQALISQAKLIRTTQMSFLSYDLIRNGYQIFVHTPEDFYEIKLGADNTCSARFITKNLNFFNLWKAGEIGVNKGVIHNEGNN